MITGNTGTSRVQVTLLTWSRSCWRLKLVGALPGECSEWMEHTGGSCGGGVLGPLPTLLGLSLQTHPGSPGKMQVGPLRSLTGEGRTNTEKSTQKFPQADPPGEGLFQNPILSGGWELLPMTDLGRGYSYQGNRVRKRLWVLQGGREVSQGSELTTGEPLRRSQSDPGDHLTGD